MPREQQFQQTYLTTPRQWAEDPYNKGDDWESYVTSGGANPVYGIAGYPMTGDMPMMVEAMTTDPGAGRKYVWSFSSDYHPADYPLDFLNPPFPAGQWSIGSRIQIIGYEEGNRIVSTYKMITFQNAIQRQYPGVGFFLDMVDELGFANMVIPQLRFGLWFPTSTVIMPLSPTGETDRDYSAAWRGSRAGSDDDSGVSKFPWVIAAAIAAKILL
jgi:hypothetical protein